MRRTPTRRDVNREARTTWLLLVGVALSLAALELLTGLIPPYGKALEATLKRELKK